MRRASATPIYAPHPLEFFARLRWLDGRPLLDTIEAYRRQIFTDILFTFDEDRPRYNLAVCGRAKKNAKTLDLSLGALYRFLVWPSPAGCDAFILANDEGQAADDLGLIKKLIAANPILAREVEVRSKEIIRKDGAGKMQILAAGDVTGAHGKTYLFVGFDEIHGYRNHDLFEALAPDPTRDDALTWITSYAGIRHAPGIPLYDLMQTGRRRDDPRMFFSWYGDAITAADAAVNAAQQTFDDLVTQRDAVTVREQQLIAERAKISFAAHGTGNAKSKTCLSTIHRELAEIGSEIASLDAAADEAKVRLSRAQEAARRAVERERAREALDYLDQLLGHAYGADAALRRYIEAITALDHCAQRVCSVASRPGRDIVQSALKRSLYAALAGHARIYELPLLSPKERQPLARWAESWAAAIKSTLAQLVAQTEPEEQTKDAA